MKKLISVFAALALVGSLAAQKGKKAPAKPAAPAVAAPKAPAVPAVVAAAPSAASAGKGAGLFVEGYGQYTLANGTSQSYADGNATTTVAADAFTYKTSKSSALGGGGAIGYNIFSTVALVGSFDYRAFKTREWTSTVANTPATGAGTTPSNASTTKAVWSKSWNNMVIGIGFRPQVSALGGTFYGGAGLAIVLPYKETLTETDTTTAGQTTKRTIEDNWNLGLGAYGEFGYNFNVTDMVYIGLGVKVIVVTVDNKDKTRVNTTDATGAGGVVSTTTTTYTDSTSATAAANVTTGNDTTNKAAYSTNGITDITGKIVVGFRF